jgi:anionic cell wall polymer biosynthesis LytR-Cps2A-Psr (LCP) family protein
MPGLFTVRRSRVVLLLVLILSATSLAANPVLAGERQRAISLRGLGAALAGPFQPLLNAIEGSQAVSTGSDGRLTVLLLGSDSRGSSVSRTDSIMVVSIKGSSISAASIPRDTARIPNPAGGTFRGKVNGIVRSYIIGGASQTVALSKFEVVIEKLLQIEIDYYALVWFNGFTELVEQVDPIYVSTPEIRDGKLIDDHDPSMPMGVYFPASSSYSLYAWNTGSRKYCNGLWKNDTSGAIDSTYWCHRALPFVRSRKGRNNNDWVRSSRQQKFVISAIKAVTNSEAQGLATFGASREANGHWQTNMPLTTANAIDLYNRLHNASLTHAVVFKPNGYATRIKGTSGWQLKLANVRAWTAQYMR